MTDPGGTCSGLTWDRPTPADQSQAFVNSPKTTKKPALICRIWRRFLSTPQPKPV